MGNCVRSGNDAIAYNCAMMTAINLHGACWLTEDMKEQFERNGYIIVRYLAFINLTQEHASLNARFNI